MTNGFCYATCRLVGVIQDVVVGIHNSSVPGIQIGWFSHQLKGLKTVEDKDIQKAVT